jgi:hypothetical protein
MGVEVATVQRILRHSSISVTTGTYVHVIEQIRHAAVAGMDSLLNPAQWRLPSSTLSSEDQQRGLRSYGKPL